MEVKYMEKKKTLLSVAIGALLLVSLSFGTGASAMLDPGPGGGGSKPPSCVNLPNPCLPT